MNNRNDLRAMELWVGFSHECLFWAKLAGYSRCKIVNKTSQAVGYRRPLRIHLCGNYTELSDWPNIFDAFKTVEAMGYKVEWVKH